MEEVTISIDTIYLILSCIVAVYEVLARVIPTHGNWSLIHLFVKLLDLLIKNRAETPNKKFTVAKIEEDLIP